MPIDQAHPDDVKAFDSLFWKHPEAQRLLKNIENYQRTNKYVQCMQEKQKLDKLRRKSFEVFIRDYEVTVKTIDLKDVEMPDEQREKLNTLYITIYMACDIIESGVLDINDNLKKISKSLEVVQFDELKNMAKQVKEKLNFLDRTDGYMKLNAWGTTCDNMYGLMQNKARSLVRKKIQEDNKQK